MEDSQIIALFYARSEQAITELSEKYGKVCCQIARNILKNPQDAEECVNDAYLGIWNSVPPQQPNPLSAYLYRIVRNLSIRKYHTNTAIKRNHFYDVALEELEDCISSASFVEEEVAVKELSRLLDLFLGNLRQENRVLFVRRYWYADSVTDLAIRFQMSENNVSVKLSRIRSKLKRFLQKEGYLI